MSRAKLPLRASETRDIIEKKILGVLPISEPFLLASIPSAVSQIVAKEELCPYPEIPIWDQVVGRNNNTVEARRSYWLSNQVVGSSKYKPY